jgi:hypothetical protein
LKGAIVAKKKSSTGRARQGILKGTIPEPSKRLIQKAEDLEATRDERMRLGNQEVDLQRELIELMHAEKVDKVDLSSGRQAALAKEEAKEKIKLSTPKKPKDEE